MAIEARVDWVEARLGADGRYENFYIIAEKHNDVWRFFERSMWSITWQDCEPTPALIEQAEMTAAYPPLSATEDERATSEPARPCFDPGTKASRPSTQPDFDAKLIVLSLISRGWLAALFSGHDATGRGGGYA
ncbi:MAG: hypothetical protein NTZ09_08275 [Candidatus Hydrogenedentes bacterium]|nr:hypothetical protein [Candidatus Hydrogenedentota bacterium]